jgi:6-phosphofructokinase 2
MSKIVTITFNPCIDKSTTVPAFIPEKKLTCTAPKLEPGGGGINVARAIKKLGGEALAIFPSGGYTGKFLNHLVELENVNFIAIDIASETRENIIILEMSTNNQYRFGMPGTPLQEKEWEQCIQVVASIEDAEFIVASGSLPPGAPADIYAELAKITKECGAKMIVDTSGEALKAAAKEGVYLLKPSIGELSSLTGIAHIQKEEIEVIAKELIHQNACEVMVVSLGIDGAVLVTEKESYRVTAPQVERKSTVGAGDSMVAGIVLSLSGGMTFKQALQYGVACGTAATMNAGTELCHIHDVENLYKMITSENTISELLV